MTRSVDRSATPLTVTSLTEQLQTCGLVEGQTVLVHMAMSKLGWIIGGAEAVILALLAAVGESGTIMMPAYSSSNLEPSNAQNPPIPQKWWQAIRDHTPAYNPLTTPTSGIGVVPELFRTWPGTVRSAHPAFSLAAHGPNAEYLVADHALNQLAGDRSPFGKLYELNGHVLLLNQSFYEIMIFPSGRLCLRQAQATAQLPVRGGSRRRLSLSKPQPGLTH